MHHGQAVNITARNLNEIWLPVANLKYTRPVSSTSQHLKWVGGLLHTADCVMHFQEIYVTFITYDASNTKWELFLHWSSPFSFNRGDYSSLTGFSGVPPAEVNALSVMKCRWGAYTHTHGCTHMYSGSGKPSCILSRFHKRTEPAVEVDHTQTFTFHSSWEYHYSQI